MTDDPPAPQRPLHAWLQRPRASEKAREIDADALILDLEDARRARMPRAAGARPGLRRASRPAAMAGASW